MPNFPNIDRVALPVIFERYIPGKLHPDGQRYLPLLVFALADGAHIGVVDRHHLVDPDLAGRPGIARLVFLLSNIGFQPPGMQRRGILPEEAAPGRVSTAPEAFGCIVAVLTWEMQRGVLPYAALYTELLLDVGIGMVGVRTNITADDLAAKLGKPRLESGDWVHVARSRIDILGFNTDERPTVKDER